MSHRMLIKTLISLTLLLVFTTGQVSAAFINPTQQIDIFTKTQELADAIPFASNDETIRVSVASDGTEGNGQSDGPSISADGRYIAFSSEATNLDANDTSIYGVFVHDAHTRTTVQISPSGVGASISDNGRFVSFLAFNSPMADLVEGVYISERDYFVADTQTGVIKRVSVHSNGTPGSGHNEGPTAISPDGRYVVFGSGMTLAEDDTDDGYLDIYFHDMQTGTTSLVSKPINVEELGMPAAAFQGNSYHPTISNDGRFIAFETWFFQPPLYSSVWIGVFVYDTQTDKTTTMEGFVSNAFSASPTISGNGRYLAFTSSSSSLVPNDTNEKIDTFLHDLQTGETTRVSVSSNGEQGNDDSYGSSGVSVSDDGRYIVFNSVASNLVPNDTHDYNLFVRDTLTNTTNKINVTNDGSTPDQTLWEFGLSGNGEYLVFSSEASNIVNGDTNNKSDVFVQGQSYPQSPPVILVHGWQGLAHFDGNPDTNGYFCDGIEKYPNRESTLLPHPDLENYSHLAEWLEADGYQVWIAHLKSNSDSTNPLETNAKCLEGQINEVWQANPQGITIIAHSMGGLVSRAAMKYIPADVDIKSLITLGSPHSGLPTAAFNFLKLPVLNCGKQPAMCEMSIISMNYINIATGDESDRLPFNAKNKNQPNEVNYYFFGGKGGGGFTDALLTLLNQGPNDGLVGQYSAVGWIYDNQVSFPPNWSIGANRYFTNEVHSAGKDPTKEYYYAAPQGEFSQSYRCIREILIDPNNTDNCSTDPSNPLQTQLFADSLSTEVYGFTEIHSGSLDPTTEASHTMTIDTTGETTFFLNWSGGSSPAFSITRPDAVEITEQYAQNNPAEVTYEVAEGTPSSAPYQAFVFPAGQSGVWEVKITASADPIDYQVFAMLETSRTLLAETDKGLYKDGETAVITATLENAGNPLTGASITAKIISPAGAESTISLLDNDADGTYSGTYPISDTPGYLTIDITASGTDDGTDYTRNTLLFAAIAPNNLTLTGNYSEEPVDNDLNFLYEKLDMHFDIDLSEAGEYAINAELYAGERLITHAGDFFDLPSGSQTITLSFDGDAIRQSGLNGPYTITNLYLTPIEVGITEQSEINVLETSAYDYSQFGTVSDSLQPTVVSSTLANTSPTSAASVEFTVTFSESVQNVDVNDFSLTKTGGITGESITNVTGSSSTRTVTVNTGTGNGTIRLDVPNTATIKNLSENALTGLPFTSGEEYIVDKTVPIISTITRSSTSPTSSTSVNFTVTFSEPVTGVDANGSDFTLTASSGLPSAVITGVTPVSASVYTVSVNTGSGSGTLRLDVPVSATIEDLNGNQLTGLPFTSGQEYIKTASVTYKSNAANDGWITESSETSNAGGSMNSTNTTLLVGDASGDKQIRTILDFDTSALPNNAIITSASIKMMSESISGSDPFSVLGSLYVDMKNPSFGSSPLELADFSTAAKKVKMGIFNPTPVSGWYSVRLTTGGRLYINRTGATQFRLYFSVDDNDDLGADFIRFFSGNATAANRPKLIIQYYVP